MLSSRLKKGVAMVYGYTAKGWNGTTLRKELMIWSASLIDPMVKIRVFLLLTPSAEHLWSADSERWKKKESSFQEIFDAEKAEGKAVKLKLPQDGATLFCIDRQMPKIIDQKRWSQDSYLRYVVYIHGLLDYCSGWGYAPGMPWYWTGHASCTHHWSPLQRN